VYPAMTRSASSSTAAAGPSTGNVAGPSTNPALEANYFKRLHPRKYLSRFLEEGYRPDARKVDAWRDLAINVGASSS
jgi:exosome complex component RRP43